MIAKRCSTPKGGGSARAGVRYILGYAVGEKHGPAETQNHAFVALMNESRERGDAGIGATWKPTNGDSKRPSAIYAEGFASLATADLEMEGWHAANGQTAESVAHEVFSFRAEDGNVSDERIVDAVRHAYEIAGFGDAPKIIAIHRDTAHSHAHVIRSRVDPRTLRAYDHTMLNTRLDRGCRSAEIADGKLNHDRGLMVVRKTVEGTKYIDHSTYGERKTWKRGNRAQRIADRERRRYADVSDREGSFERYAEANVEPRMREVLRRFEDRSETPLAIDVLNVAARRGTKLEVVGEGEELKALLRDVSTREFRTAQCDELASYEKSIRNLNGEQRDEALAAFREKQVVALEGEVARVECEGEVVPLSTVSQRALGDLNDYRTFAHAEEAFSGEIERDPGRVARELTRSDSTFSRDDIERYVAARMTDVGEVERLTECVVNNDRNLVMLSPDVEGSIFTTFEMLGIETELAARARTLATARDERYSNAAVSRAIDGMQAERTRVLRSRGDLAADESFTLSSEQRSLLERLDSRLVVCRGIAGAGKTTVMEGVRRYAEAVGRDVVGITLAQAAAERLEAEAGFSSVNSALALMYEERGQAVIPRGGIVVVDEAAMVDSRTMNRLLATADERDATVLAIGDHTQLSAVGAGHSFGILANAAKTAKSYFELTEIRRQRNAWHREAVYAMSAAIEHTSAKGISTAVELWERNGALRFSASQADAIRQAVEWYGAQRESGDDALLVASDKDTVRYLNEEIRKQRGLGDKGWVYTTDQGPRRLTDGDRLIFRQNNRRLYVWNGDTGTILSHDKYRVSVLLDRNEKTITFDVRKYANWDHGYAATIHSAQGASVSAVGTVLDQSATAQLAHVATSRSRDALAVFASTQAFADRAALAEHLAARIDVKATTQDVSALVNTRGGQDTYVALNARALRESEENRFVVAYERAQSERAAHLAIALADTRARYHELRGNADPSQRGRLNSEQYAEEKKLVKAHTPDKKGEWLADHRELNAIRANANNSERIELYERDKNMSDGPAYLQDELRRLRLTYDQWLAQQGMPAHGHSARTDKERTAEETRASRTLRVEEVTQGQVATRGAAARTATVHRDERGRVAFIDRTEALHAKTIELKGDDRGTIPRPFEIDVPNPTRDNIAAALDHYKSRYGDSGALVPLRFVGNDRVTKVWVAEAQLRGFSVEHALSHDDRVAAYAKANERSIRVLGRDEMVEGRVARIQARDGGATVLIAAKDSPSEFIRTEVTVEQAKHLEVGDNIRAQENEIERAQEEEHSRVQELARER